jgi:hypothetical protein
MVQEEKNGIKTFKKKNSVYSIISQFFFVLSEIDKFPFFFVSTTIPLNFLLCNSPIFKKWNKLPHSLVKIIFDWWKSKMLGGI